MIRTGTIMTRPRICNRLLDCRTVLRLRRLRARIVIIEQYPVGRSLQVIKLAAAYCPEEQPGDNGDEQQGNRNQEVKGFHASPSNFRSLNAGNLRRRNALTTTTSELADMPSAASSGVIHPIAANGSPTTL